MNYTFSLATFEDDADLRRLLARNAMPGDITVTFEREPSYFLGCGTMGRFWQVAVAREDSTGEIAGILCRAAHPHFVNGQSEELGYIGQLRVDHRYRGTWLLSQGLEFIHKLHQDGRVRACFAAISDENRVARGVLVEHPRPGFPTLRELAHIVTLGIILRKPFRPKNMDGVPNLLGDLRGKPEQVRDSAAPDGQKLGLWLQRGTLAQLPAIVAFLQREGARKQLFPVYTEADFTSRDTTLGFSIEDFIVARRGEAIVGVAGLWDQSGYKQSVVQGYAPGLRRLRPFYNVGAKLLGAQPLPAVGEHIHSAYASFICTQDNDPALFRPLLKAVVALAAARGYAYLMLGLAEGDPLLPVARAYPHITYHSHLYTVAWDDAADFHAQLDGRVPYIEIAAL